MLLFRTFTFDAAHYLPNVPENHKCRQVHGHTYIMTIYLEGTPDAHYGWVLDFAELKATVGAVVDLVDHKMLNNIPGLQNPTCELLAMWLWNNIKPGLPGLRRIHLNETPTSGVIYEGD